MYKRSLYTVNNAGQRPKRKTLAQGRLVNDSGPTSGKSRGVLAHGIDVHVRSVDERVPPQIHNEFPACKMVSDSTNSEENEPTASITPRKKAPCTTEQNSPARVRKTDSLDLSDSDEEIDKGSKIDILGHQKLTTDDVMVLDASSRLADPDQVEVDTVVCFSKSPARVICHSPTGARRQLRNAAVKGESNKVAVTSVPAVLVPTPLPSSPRNQLSPAVRDRQTESPKSHRHLLGSLPVLTQMERMMGLSQPNFDDSGDSDAPPQPQDGKSDVMSLISESDACSISDFVTKPVSKAKPVKKAGPKTPGTAKKKTKVVPSRYMQAAQAKASVSVLMDKSSKADRSKASRSLEVPTSQPNQRVKKQIKEKRQIEVQKNPSTPESSQNRKTGKTSTPTSDVSFFSTLQTDLSAISAAGDVSKLNSDSHQFKAKARTSITQQTLDLLYGRFVQWEFLACKARRIKEEQERKAMSQMLWLQEEVQKLRKLKHDKDKELARLKHLNELDEQLDIQRECLEPVVSNLPKLTKQYETLAQALDTTRHQIPTKGIYIPQDEALFHSQLEQILQESEYLLGNLSASTGQPLHSATATVARHLASLEKHTNQQCQQLKSCNEMIAATQSLTVEESSLLIQKEVM